jgi:hypothetical protein
LTFVLLFGSGVATPLFITLTLPLSLALSLALSLTLALPGLARLLTLLLLLRTLPLISFVCHVETSYSDCLEMPVFHSADAWNVRERGNCGGFSVERLSI